MNSKKVLLAHNRYKYRGGEDVVFEQESQLLADYSHDVHKYILDNKKELGNIWKKLLLIFNTHYSKRSYKDIQEKITAVSPDLVHVHNFFPLITPAIFYAAKDNNVPVVFTLHNYRLFHPNGLLLNNGKIDERGLTNSAYQCIKDKVYRDSYLQTAVVAHMIEYHKKRNTWNNKVDRFIALSNFAKKKFIEGGLPEDKIRVKPNYVDDPIKNSDLELISNKSSYFIFVGRISTEKDVETVIHCWELLDDSFKLKIIGKGPLKQELQRETKLNSNIEWMGEVSRKKVFKEVSRAKALIFSSRCYENFPLTILEAFSVATPVISSDIGSQSEIVRPHFNGLQFKTGNSEDLASKVTEISSDPVLAAMLSDNARKEYENKYTPKKNMEQLNQIYDEVV